MTHILYAQMAHESIMVVDRETMIGNTPFDDDKFLISRRRDFLIVTLGLVGYEDRFLNHLETEGLDYSRPPIEIYNSSELHDLAERRTCHVVWDVKQDVVVSHAYENGGVCRRKAGKRLFMGHRWRELAAVSNLLTPVEAVKHIAAFHNAKFDEVDSFKVRNGRLTHQAY